MPRKVFVAGEILTAADVNTNLMDQSVMSFAGSAARGSAIPSPTEGMVAYLDDADRLEVYTTAWEPVNTGFTAGTTITATNASFSVPSLGAPIVRVTVIGGGGGGGAGFSGTGGSGGTGGTTTFNAGGAGTVSAVGGIGGTGGTTTARTGTTGLAGPTAGNGGTAGNEGGVSPNRSFCGSNGTGGVITVAYLNLTGISTVDVTIGGGGTAGTGGQAGGLGGRGEVILEYVAA